MSEELKHYGVKGMKWGIRRYQPYPKGGGPTGKFVAGLKRGSKTIVDTASKPYRRRVGSLTKRYEDRGHSKEQSKKMAKIRARGELAALALGTVSLASSAAKHSKVIGREYIDKTIKPGTKIQNISFDRERDMSKPFYAVHDKMDKVKYKGRFGGTGVAMKDVAHKYLIESKEPIKIASHGNARKVLQDTLDNSPEFRKIFKQATNTDTLTKRSYELFNSEIAHIHYVDYTKGTNSLKPFYDNLKSKGYNGLLDLTDQKGAMQAKHPSIIFDRGKNFVTEVSRLGLDEQMDATRQLIKKENIQDSIEGISSMLVPNALALSTGSVIIPEAYSSVTRDDIKQESR